MTFLLIYGFASTPVWGASPSVSRAPATHGAPAHRVHEVPRAPERRLRFSRQDFRLVGAQVENLATFRDLRRPSRWPAQALCSKTAGRGVSCGKTGVHGRRTNRTSCWNPGRKRPGRPDPPPAACPRARAPSCRTSASPHASEVHRPTRSRRCTLFVVARSAPSCPAGARPAAAGAQKSRPKLAKSGTFPEIPALKRPKCVVFVSRFRGKRRRAESREPPTCGFALARNGAPPEKLEKCSILPVCTS